MSKLKKLKLSEMSKSELQAREMNKLLGGSNCCICPCDGSSSSYDNGNANNTGNISPDRGGYGSGAYG